jgi:predicted transcriptional regulator
MAAKKYDKELHDEIVKLSKLGHKQVEIAKLVGIAEATLSTWLNHEYPELGKDVKKARRQTYEIVVDKLLQACLGSTYEESTTTLNPNGTTKEKRINKKVKLPSLAAIIFFLTNRASDMWSRKDHVDIIISKNEDSFDIEKVLKQMSNDERDKFLILLDKIKRKNTEADKLE